LLATLNKFNTTGYYMFFFIILCKIISTRNLQVLLLDLHGHLLLFIVLFLEFASMFATHSHMSFTFFLLVFHSHFLDFLRLLLNDLLFLHHFFDYLFFLDFGFFLDLRLFLDFFNSFFNNLFFFLNFFLSHC